MSDTLAVYLMLGVGLTQFVCFFLSVGFYLIALKDKDKVASYRSSIWGGFGFLCMSFLAFFCLRYLTGEEQIWHGWRLSGNTVAWITWLSGCTTACFAFFCLWLGFIRRKLHRKAEAAEEARLNHLRRLTGGRR